MSTFSELIDFTRSSTGTYLDSVVYGDELVTNGTFDTDSDWDKQNGWSITNGEAVYATGTGREILQISIPTVAGKTYKVEFDITSRVVGAVGAYSLESVQNSATYKSTVGPYVRFLTATGSVMALRIRSSAVSANLSIDNVSLKEVIGGQGTAGTPLLRTADTNEPRLEYDASGQPLGLLIEEQRTNEITQSNFNSVTKQEVTTVNDYAVAPDGTNTAVAMFETTNNFYHRAYRNPSYLNGNTYTQSVFLKSIGGRAGQLTMTASGFGSIYANFDLVNGVVGDKNNCESQITPVGNGWYRCSITATAIADATGDASVVSVTSPTSARLETYAGDTSKGLLVYGLQVEIGASPTSYIPTSGSTVTRNKDVCDTPVERFGYSNTKGSIVVYAQSNKPAVGVYAFELAVNSSDRMFSKFYTAEHLRVRVSNADTAVLDVGNIETGSFAKLGARFATNDFAISKDGNTPVTDTNGDVNLNSSELKIGQSFSNNEHLNGHIKRIQYFPTKLSNDELVELTKPSSSPTMSLTFDGQATSELVEGLHD